jgi:predicted RNA-binding Zn-ribbon protein involved in translation (DUF1610 family)
VPDLTDIDAHRKDGPRPLSILFFDIECTPMVSFLWDLKADYVNPDMVIQESFFLSWAAKWSGQPAVISERLTGPEAQAKDDARIVAKLADLIRQADVVVAHNGDRFDLPKLNARVAVHGLQPLGNVKSIDTLKKARQAFKFKSNRLGELAESVGIPGKFPTSFDLWRRCMAGDVPALKEMDAYCRQDVVVLEQVFEALRPYVKGLPRLVDASEYGQRVCPTCGSSDLARLDKPHRTNANAYDKFLCNKCGRECKSFRQSSAPKLEMRPL